MAYQYPLNGGRINATISGNTAGAGALVSTGTLSLAGGNNITLSQNGNAITISGASIPSGTVNFSAGNNTSLTSTGTYDARSLYLNAYGAASAGFSQSSLFVSVPTQTNQTLGLYGTGNTTGQSSSTTFDARSFTVSGAGAASVGFSSSRMQISVPAVSSLSVTGILSISNNGSTVSIGAPAVSIGMSTLGNTSGTTGTVSNQLIFAGGNNITLSQSTAAGGNTITISAPNQSVQTQSLIAGLYDGVNSISSGTARISAAGALTASINGQTLSLSAPVVSSLSATGAVSISNNGGTISIGAPTQTAQTLGLYATGANTTGQSSSNTLDARSFSISAQGGLYAGMSGNTLQLSAATTYAASNHSHGNPTLNLTNLSGTTASASNGFTLSLSAGAQSNQTLAFTAGTTNGGNTSLTSTGTFDARSLYLNAHGIITAGFSSSSIFLSASQSAQTQSNVQGIIASGSTNRTGDISFANSNGVTFGLSNNTVTASVAAAGGNNTIGMSNLGNTSGTTGVVSGSAFQYLFAGGNNITLSQSLNGSTGTVTISAASQTVQTLGLYATGNTTGQSSSSTFDARNVTMSGLGGISVGYSSSRMQISAPAMSSLSATGALSLSTNGSTISIGAPATSSLSATGAVSLSTNGSTISIGAPAISTLSATGGVSMSTNGSTVYIGASQNGTVSNWEPMILNQGSVSNAQVGHGSIFFMRLQPETFINASQLLQLVSLSISSSSNSSHAGAISIAAGIYTASGSTLSLITQSSGSQSYQWTNTSSNSINSLSGLRGLTIPINVSMSAGNYWVGLLSRTASTNTNWYTASNMVFTNQSAAYQGVLGAAANATKGIQEGVGVYSTTSTALPASAAFSVITQSNLATNSPPYIAFKNQTW